MSSARHHFQSGTFSDDQLTKDIQADVAASRKAQQELTSEGQYGIAARMGETVDEHLDELNDVKRGSWSPRHA